MNIALLLSGGTGSRIRSEVPKQYIRVGEQMIVTRSLCRLMSHGLIDGVWVVATREWQDAIVEDMAGALRDYASDNEQYLQWKKKLMGFSAQGETRADSIYRGLLDLRKFMDPMDVVLIHDAARPRVSQELITACLMACATHDGAMPVLPMKDTVYESEDGKTVSKLLERNHVFAGQAPEAFRYGKYIEAYRRIPMERIALLHGSSEPAVVAGMDIAMIPGEESNYKITTDEDLKRFMKQEG